MAKELSHGYVTLRIFLFQTPHLPLLYSANAPDRLESLPLQYSGDDL